MRILVVGGTGFLGGAVVDAALAAGHAVTVFTRGRTARALPPGVEVLVGDRHGDLAPLRGRSFGAIVDTCAYAPDAVESLLDAVGGAIDRYALISSISVYADYATPGIHEESPTKGATEEQLAMARALPPGERSSAASYGAAYGPLKRECERVALDRFGDRAVVVRAGLLVGAGDYTDRLTYWVRRIDQGGTIPCPGDPERRVQLIDVRDVARWTLSAAASAVGGVFNVTGRPFPRGALFEACRRVAGSDARFAWVPEDRVLGTGLAPWSEVPVWMPESNEAFRYFLEVDVDKAFAQGLETRPLDETVGQILAWDRGRRAVPLKAGMPPDKEAALLAVEANAV